VVAVVNEERERLVRSLERHALECWTKEMEYLHALGNDDKNRVRVPRIDYEIAQARLVGAARALGEYDAAIHPVEEEKP
jgi:hypothetical protein